ncbi:MAG: hypothetical protein FWF59_03730 [Turicibacter sp.]|nr:hypothetical protein [Turicibacter sp.]
MKDQLLMLNAVLELSDVKCQGKNQEFYLHVVELRASGPGEALIVFDGSECALHGQYRR